ncbi:hypothetical protein CMU89_09205 [Elizabethkingia anophelis]|uniref:hypothetical protein n=1 Tax=Elizabethkingia anophelis TaxID=1117645 RepID=UPI0004E32FF8|nr:hypothetical protein [Elizabethkingia anophelis]AKH93454.1 hypothetical protein M876_02595 [Elizabethkingia anophelis FMS-007]KFC38826.1 hypothetical protein FF18_15660 [Elizabethkingia anophelis]MDV3502189.1 hypothetical protein [Elizabethkingia anophelis]MDV3506641.1 hypothetical protein [Elizabethkingia anophelis]MDV3542826.1 hypothetical protein [Elizabethkingia anophelis]
MVNSCWLLVAGIEIFPFIIPSEHRKAKKLKIIFNASSSVATGQDLCPVAYLLMVDGGQLITNNQQLTPLLI